MKYVMLRQKNVDNNLFIFPVIFPDHLNHSDMVPNGYEAISAGFIGETYLSFNKSDDGVYGKSDSLKLKPHKNDIQHLYNWFTYGEPVMIMSSLEYDL